VSLLVDAAADAPPLAQGERCETGARCATGYCAGGYCCNTACVQGCFTCSAPGAEGTCSPVVAGQDPGNHCEQDPQAACGRDGLCDGAGECRRYPVGTECAPGSCQGAVEHAASTCDGRGACVAGGSRSCGGSACLGSSCATRCTGDGDCQTGFFCEDGACQIKRSVGAGCYAARECGSGHCVQGVCCGSACQQSCHSCSLAVARGTCTPVPRGQDPGSHCLAEPVATCGRAGGCDGTGGCLLYPATTTCAAASCSGSLEAAESRCDGAGTCVGGATRDCTPYTCAGTSTCASSCSSSASCRAGYSCVASRCVVSGLLLYWALDEASGALASDSSGSGFHGTGVGTSGIPAPSSSVPTLRFADPRSRAFSKDSRHAIELMPMPSSLKLASFTLSAWFRATVVDSMGSDIVSGGNDYFLRLWVDQIEFVKRVSQTAGALYAGCRPATSGHLDGRWHHVAAVNGPSGMKVYLDGVQTCSNSRTEPVLYQGSAFYAGRPGADQSSHDFDGNLDELRVYGRVLTPAEIASLAQGNF
jgi:Concanavalin A-like lectin/glucanases superfamily